MKKAGSFNAEVVKVLMLCRLRVSSTIFDAQRATMCIYIYMTFYEYNKYAVGG